MIAAIGTDGMREVVWGLGDDEASCLADAALQNDGKDVGELRLVSVSEQQAERIRAGVVAVSALGIASA